MTDPEPAYAGHEPGAPKPGKPRMPGWLVAVVLTIGIVVILGMAVVALGVRSYVRFVRLSKMAEARMMVGKMGRDVAESFDATGRLCPSASKPVPIDVDSVRGRSYQSSPAEWAVDGSVNAGFACLGFAVSDPQYYQYDYKSTGSGSPGSSFRAIGQGDLDGDGDLSSFVLEGRVAPGGLMVLSPNLVETEPEE